MSTRSKFIFGGVSQLQKDRVWNLRTKNGRREKTKDLLHTRGLSSLQNRFVDPHLSRLCCFNKSEQPGDFVPLYLRPETSECKSKNIFEFSKV